MPPQSFVFFFFFGSIIALGLPSWFSGKESACSAGASGDVGSVRGSRKSPGGGNGNPLQYSCLDNPMDRGDWRAIDHRVSKHQTRLSTHAYITALQCCVSFCCTMNWISCMYTCTPFVLSLPSTLAHSAPPEHWAESSLCYRAASHQLLASLLHMAVYICQCHSPNSSHPFFLPYPHHVHKLLLYNCISICSYVDEPRVCHTEWSKSERENKYVY